jgi:hypothetical protein
VLIAYFSACHCQPLADVICDYTCSDGNNKRKVATKKVDSHLNRLQPVEKIVKSTLICKQNNSQGFVAREKLYLADFFPLFSLWLKIHLFKSA